MYNLDKKDKVGTRKRVTKKVEEELMEEREREGRVIKEVSDQERELKRMQVTEAEGEKDASDTEKE